jgi:glucose-6-phosphate dehydrogenase assembly protein OpcA
LKWQPISFTETKGDYDLRHIQFKGPNQKPIAAELASIPVTDSGEILGDLVGIRLGSTNPDANCSTILCSETGGCMRMEAGGGAQLGRTEQVTSTTDQNAEFLLSQQLQRWGRDVLFEETLELAVQIVKLHGHASA